MPVRGGVGDRGRNAGDEGVAVAWGKKAEGGEVVVGAKAGVESLADRE